MTNSRRNNNSQANRRNAVVAAASNSIASGMPSMPADTSVPSLPVSGSEQVFTEQTYGTKRGKGNNNCYGYAIDKYRNFGSRKLQPGNLAKQAGQLDLASCAALTARAMKDLKRKAYVADAQSACRPGYYKIMGFLDPNNDFHWYKQHKDALVKLSKSVADVGAVAKALGVAPQQVLSPSPAPRPGDTVLVKDAKVWSHKQGFATGPLLRDACGKAIRDPRKACRNYGSLNYERYCGSMCVRSSTT